MWWLPKGAVRCGRGCRDWECGVEAVKTRRVVPSEVVGCGGCQREWFVVGGDAVSGNAVWSRVLWSLLTKDQLEKKKSK
jgi:hypothetical protein